MFDFFPTLKKLSPKGNAFFLFKEKFFTKLYTGLGKEPDRICIFFDQVQKSGIPDGNIPSEALADWETFLNLPTNTGLTDAERNERITGKIAAQGGQGPDYIQDTLQAAGFPVYVTENIPSQEPSVRVYTSTLGGFSLGNGNLGAYTDRVDPRGVTGLLIAGPPIWETLRLYDASLGGISLGGSSAFLGSYVGTLTQQLEVVIPNIPSRFIFIWFLTGPDGLDDFVDIPADREFDFVSQVLQIKPAHTWVIAQVNFV